MMWKMLFLVIVALLGIFLCCIARVYSRKIEGEEGAKIILVQNAEKELWIGAAGMILCYLMLCIITLVLDAPVKYLMAGMFFLMFLAGIFLIWIALLWRGYMTEEFLIIKCPPFIYKKIRLWEITQIKKTEFSMIGYAGRKKLFTLEYDIVGREKVQMVTDAGKKVDAWEIIDMEELYQKAVCAGKLERPPVKENFCVRTTWNSIMVSAIAFVITGGCLIDTMLGHTEMEPGLTGALVLMTALFLYVLLSAMVWRMEVTYQTIIVRQLFHGTKEYKLKEITVKHQGYGYGNGMKMAELYCNGKKIAGLSDKSENYYLLMRRLEEAKRVV